MTSAWSCLILALALPGADGVDATARQKPPSILFLAIDDLNDWVGCLGGHPQAFTPNIDRLARRGTLFANAHCQAPLCNPSRSSLLTGLRPTTTGIYALQPGFRKSPVARDRTTLPQHLAAQGYSTFAAGKLFHDGSVPPADRPRELQAWGNNGPMPFPTTKLVATPAAIKAMDWGIFPERDEDQADWKIADSAIARLRSAPADAPFFIAAGFRLPHVPCFASKRWFDLHPLATLARPHINRDDRSDVPDFAWNLHWKLPEPRLSWLEQNDQWLPLVRAYLASTSFMDSQVGRVLDALEASGRADETIVVLWSDHGWHLGEKGITGKNTLWERSTRVPLIFAGPGIARDARCDQPAELLDLYPTLIELAGLPAVAGLEGHSLAPQLRDPAAPRPWPAITTHNPGNHAVRSKDWRYIRYADGSEELYDHRTDPDEWINLAKDPRHAETIREHARWLPAADAPPAPGSVGRLLTRGVGGWLWDGEPIVPADLQR
ncbi:sulfatase [Tundrisphaera sp. TA3]|uniref:sulfatase n=1 Tax=Tundrisphaera sp. TA3 TaxID=3435775 RepID=UPI003EB789A7